VDGGGSATTTAVAGTGAGLSTTVRSLRTVQAEAAAKMTAARMTFFTGCSPSGWAGCFNGANPLRLRLEEDA